MWKLPQVIALQSGQRHICEAINFPFIWLQPITSTSELTHWLRSPFVTVLWIKSVWGVWKYSEAFCSRLFQNRPSSPRACGSRTIQRVQSLELISSLSINVGFFHIPKGDIEISYHMMKVSNVTVKSLFCKTAILNQWAAEAVALPNG